MADTELKRLSLKLDIFFRKEPCGYEKNSNFAPGEMAERSNAAVLKTVVGYTTGGSNPSFSAEECE
jgi:hypothetical protein